MPPKPFISYAREDQAAAVRLYGDLKAADIEPWLDLAELLPGHEWASKIKDALRDASHVIVLISAHSVDKTGFVQNETREVLELANSRPPGAIFIIPVRLDTTVPKHEQLRKLQWVDLFSDYAGGVSKIRASLGVQQQSESTENVIPPPIEHDFADVPSGTALTDETLVSFLNTNRLSLHVDNRIADLTLSRGLAELSPLGTSCVVESLYVAGIDSVEQLERVLRKHREIILRWAKEWLGGERGPVSQGTYLTYLGYVVICEAGDLDRLKEFLEAAHIQAPATVSDTAERILQAYRALTAMRTA